jgi:hypothetical protein
MRRPKFFGKDLKIILTLIKGQLISKGLFGVFNSSKKTNENKWTRGIISTVG